MPLTHRARRAVAVACAAALALVLSACAPQPSVSGEEPPQVDAALPGDAQAQLQAAVERAVAASGASGAVAGVWVPWAGTWLAGSGTVSPGGAATTADTTFKAGAITRAMTCDVLYGLAKDGVVKLDDPVTNHVPGVADQTAITLEQLCDSTAGVAAYGDLLAARFSATPERVWNPRELVSYGLGHGASDAPGTTFADSDTGYVLLGLALESASGRSADELLAQYVFEPIGMTASSLPTEAQSELSGLYTPNGADGAVACGAPVDMTSLSPSAGYTASGVASDLTDLGRYARALATGSRSYDDPERFATPRPAAGDAPSWFTADGGAYQAGTLIGQYGSIPGYLTAAFADRNTGMTVVVVLNDSRASAALVRSLAWQLAAIASKVPATDGQTAPAAGLPWTADEMAAQVAATAVCPIP